MWKQLRLYYSAKHEVLNRPWVKMTACLEVCEACIAHAQEQEKQEERKNLRFIICFITETEL